MNRRGAAIPAGHWGIENRLHEVREVTFGEDACQVRTGAAPHVLAALTNDAWRPGPALHLIGLSAA